MKATQGKLTDEHVIPFALDANAVIEKASCESCAAITARLEQVLARQILAQYRAHIGEQTRRPGERPTKFKFQASVNGGPLAEFEAPVSEAPYFTYMPIFNPPGIFIGAQPMREFEVSEVHRYEWVPNTLRAIVGANAGDNVQIANTQLPFRFDLFARALAKIAYCQAIASYGLDGFRRLVTAKLILGHYPYVPYFVGSSLELPPPAGPAAAKHSVVLQYTNIHRLNLFTATIRLYANSGTDEVGMPFYDVVIGAPPFTR
jgi:hypothetical protein